MEVEPIQETAFDAEDPCDLEKSQKLAINVQKTEKSESEMSFLDNWNSISDEDKRWNLGAVNIINLNLIRSLSFNHLDLFQSFFE